MTKQIDKKKLIEIGKILMNYAFKIQNFELIEQMFHLGIGITLKNIYYIMNRNYKAKLMFFSLSDFYENGNNIINIHNKHKMCHLQNMLIKSHYRQLLEYDNIWVFQ